VLRGLTFEVSERFDPLPEQTLQCPLLGKPWSNTLELKANLCNSGPVCRL